MHLRGALQADEGDMKPILLGAILAASTALPALAQDPAFPPGAPTVSLGYLDADGGPARRAPTLHMSFGGDPVRAIMDTGSTGIVVSADVIPGIDGLQSPGPGRLTYTSSGRVMVGNWVVTPVTVSGADGSSVTTAPLPVLAVDSIECLENARDCTPEDDPTRVAMLGIGFGRETDRQGQSTPDKNPFLHVAGMEAGSMRRGYVVAADGVQLGLSRETAEGFRFVKLERDEAVGDWKGVPACITLGEGEPSCGSALVDTGVTRMFLSVPSQAWQGLIEDDGAGRSLAAGTQVSVSFGTDASGPGYSFAAGDESSPAAPESIVLVGDGERPTFVNTSVHGLNAFDILYDAEGGHFGVRPVGN